MIAYLGTGERYYGDAPLKVSERQAWEFQVVLRGKIAPTLTSGKCEAKAKALWVFPPKFPHGWRGEAGKTAEVAVFHYKEVPRILHELLPSRGYYERELKPMECDRIGCLASSAQKAITEPNAFSYLIHQHILLELSLLLEVDHFLPDVAARRISFRNQVQRAMEWYREHLCENPSLTEVGRAVGVSSSHLRRLFHQFVGCHPQEVFHQITFQFAQDLMLDPEMKLETIAERCGFGSASSFSRAFKIRHGYCPAEWRKGIRKENRW